MKCLTVTVLLLLLSSCKFGRSNGLIDAKPVYDKKCEGHKGLSRQWNPVYAYCNDGTKVFKETKQ